MTGFPFGVIVEGLVSILLLLTIGYCIVLNERLKRLHADRNVLKQMIADLVQATDKANNAIRELRQTATETDLAMSARLEEADKFAVELANHVTSGRAVIDRIAKILAVAREHKELGEPTTVQTPTKRAQEALKRLRSHQMNKSEAA